ncbi:ATPase, BadF/BadG/BcrA/BcrD type [Acidothermus cellulolyticus 11B]|uniref:ATPase, BadF/BadG/BcrA/BcrD type n=1 Tax=Acidothermus cellulolyticus (strain ATCC 43068 / DSM 8971 / 11B) TaxID=351607 RepID=A0LW16_ACIC1|nr:BadF/BadG/BcrA/BcrD ATPase family protein [Acidothermus cellulolyticus]ABK53626.1 ATPase, BadF/BadG/BcrA/BcrD type [Acidothermus cellulolyticus 11B]
MSSVSILGVEATGVGTQAVLVEDGEVVARFTEGPLNVLLDASAFDRLAKLIKESGAGAAGLGLAGLRSQREAQLLEMQLRAKTGVTTVVGDDTEVAQLGAFNGGPGIVVIAHTGSNSFGRDAAGRVARAGGFGHVIGDEGSHYWIASQALRRAMRSLDGRGPKSHALERAISEAYGADLETVMMRVTENAADPGVVARVATTVMALDADPIVAEILDEAADDLIAHVRAITARLGELPVAMYGAVFDHPRIRQRFVAATGAVDVASPPVVGAVFLASRPRTQREMGFRS